jgi:hypothetical protein
MYQPIPTATFDLYVDGELKHTLVADSRGEASRMFTQQCPQYRGVAYAHRTRIVVHEHEHEPAAGNMSVCVFCQARIEATS